MSNNNLVTLRDPLCPNLEINLYLEDGFYDSGVYGTVHDYANGHRTYRVGFFMSPEQVKEVHRVLNRWLVESYHD